MHLGGYLGLRSKKQKTAEKQNSKEAKKQKSREAGKGRKAEKQRSRGKVNKKNAQNGKNIAFLLKAIMAVFSTLSVGQGTSG
jgi:hypothetical protein